MLAWLLNDELRHLADLPSFFYAGKDQRPNEHPELVQLKGLAT